jgi:hypothetical protein
VSRARFENGRSAAQQREKERERGGVQPRECHAAWGADWWVATQYRATVSLTDGFGLSTGTARGRAGAWGPAREGTEVGRTQLNSKVFHLFELV